MLDWLACGLVRVVGGLLCLLPPELAVGLGSWLGRCAMPFQAKRVRIGELNLKAAFGEALTPGQRRRLIRRLFGNLGAGLIEMLRLPAVDQAYFERYIEVQGKEHFIQASQAGRPILFLTAHFGNWEMCSIAAAFLGFPIVALARAQSQLPRLYRLLVSYRESKGCRVVHKGGAMRRLFKTLSEGGLVGIVGDQSSRQGIPVEFFGRPALFATGPFELARATGALIVPAFMHRLRGPHQRLIIGPPLELRTDGEPQALVREAIERFAALLRRHIEQDPDQWLWAHKRWKYTPARRVLVLSDGKAGHVKQSMAVVEALKSRVPDCDARVIEVRYRSRAGRWLAVLWAWLSPGGAGALRGLSLALSPDCFRRLANCYADIVVSCGSATAPVNVLLAAENRAKSVVIMSPAPLPLRRFNLAFVPAHDRVGQRAGGHVIITPGSLNAITEPALAQARDHLQTHPRFQPVPGHGPVLSVLIGGDTSEYDVSPAFADALMRQVLDACEQTGGSCLVTTSRRTSPEVERVLRERLEADPRCRLLLMASRDQLNLPAAPSEGDTNGSAAQAGGTLEGMLGWAQAIVVTAESVSMVTEACASGRPVLVVEPPRRRPADSPTKPQRLLGALLTQGYVGVHPVDELGPAIRAALAQGAPARRLDTFGLVQEAVSRLL
ncbi:MAG: mitochondrial fission ELM1 family protein [Candidatus Omnitrophica bacterium]|nr:mitochondrial fission ELM1 family protein [Candidatus Omnitrophota bacterium]